MSAFVWVFAALGNSILAAASAEINRKFKQEPYRLNMVRTAIAALIWLPIVLVQDVWPQDETFYIAALFSGLVITFGNIVLNDLSARMNGRVAVLNIPLKAMAIFAVWPFIDNAAWVHITQEQPWQVSVGLVFFGIMVAAINAMRQNDASWSALRALAPVIVFYTAADIVARLQLQGPGFGNRLIVYVFLSMLVSAVFSALMLPWRPHPEKPLISQKLFKAAGWAAVVTMMNHMCFFIGLTLAPNPAYVSMIALLAPMWLLVYHRWADIPDNASPWAGAILVLASIGFLMVTL